MRPDSLSARRRFLAVMPWRRTRWSSGHSLDECRRALAACAELEVTFSGRAFLARPRRRYAMSGPVRFNGVLEFSPSGTGVTGYLSPSAGTLVFVLAGLWLAAGLLAAMAIIPSQQLLGSLVRFFAGARLAVVGSAVLLACYLLAWQWRRDAAAILTGIAISVATGVQRGSKSSVEA